MRLCLVAWLVATSGVGCISSEERSLPDTEAAGDSSAVDIEIPEPDGSAADGAGGEIGVGCTRDDDCASASSVGLCVAERCVDGACVQGAADDGTSCEDGDPCTAGERCASGACGGGQAIDCAALGPCWELMGDPVCDANDGCPAIPRPPGSHCGEVTTATCDGGWAVPPATCDGEGACVDHAAAIPPGIHPLAGDWFFVTSSSAQGLVPHTARALLTLGGTLGTWSASNVAATSPDFAARLDTEETLGEYCAGLAGDVTLSRAGRAWDGFVDEAADLMVLAGADGDELAIAVRTSLDPSKLDGTYAFIGTAHGPGAEVTPAVITFHGTLRLGAGCIEPGSEIAALPGLGPKLEIKDGPDYCFVNDQGLLRLDGDALMNGGAVVDFRLVGATTPSGNLALFSREGDDTRYGTSLLVRIGTPGAPSLEGRWRFVSQRGGLGWLGQDAVDQVVEDGWLELDPPAAISGEVFGFFLVSDVVGGWWASSPSPARYSHRASFGDALMHHTGYATADGGCVVAMSTSAPADATTPAVLPPLVGEGSLFVMVRPVSFAPGWIDGR